MDTDPPVFEARADGSVGKPLNRVDGRLKVTGAARYTAEYKLPGLAYAVLKTSDVAKGQVLGIDAAAALRAPGVLAVYTHENLPRLAQLPSAPDRKQDWVPSMRFMPLLTGEIHYAGQPVAVVVADTLERAQHAAAGLQVRYQAAAPVASLDDPRGHVYQPEAVMNGWIPAHAERGTPAVALAAAAVRLTATYAHAVNHHNPLEPSATTAAWDPDGRLTLYETTQGVTMAQAALADMLGLPRDHVRVVTKFLGGGFGCKGLSWPHTVLTALTARAVGRPVKLVLTRPQMFTSVGHREEQRQTLSLGATAEGRLTSIVHEKTSLTSPFDDWAEANGHILSRLYACPHFETRYRLVRANTMTPTFTRAPGEMPGAFAIECSLDDLAHRLGLDPLEIRLRNYAETDPSNGQPWSSKGLRQCYARGAELFGWSQRHPTPGATRRGRLLVGMGMASAMYPVASRQGSARARLYADGHAVVESGATDMGVGTYTIMTQVAADALGLSPANIRFELGDTRLPTAPNSAGSATAGTVASAVHVAGMEVRAKLLRLAVADRQSPLFGAQPEAIAVADGRLFLSTDPSRADTHAAVLARAHLTDLEASGSAQYGSGYTPPAQLADGRPLPAIKHSMYSFGAHFCEVLVDPDLGTVRVSRWVGVHAAGRILNAKTARSQIIGGAVFGIGNALMEATHTDPYRARYTNADLAGYHIPVHADIPDMTVEFLDEHDPYINVMGAKGLGEVATVGVSAAVANAVFHATGKRVRELPITPDKILGTKAV